MSNRFARPYAKALLATAASDEAAKEVRRQLRHFAEAVTQVPQLTKMASSPAIPIEVKEEVLTEICGMFELERLAKSFLTLLMKNYRLIHLEAILESLDQILNRRLGVVTAEVTSAQPLDDDRRARLEAVLRKVLQQDVELTLRTDPKLLGGFVARIGSYRYDASVDGQLNRLAASLVQGN
jgi:F-type H+-transporting ATPase subunit delta